jgi:ribosome-binding protein aMBF1 (putative translation factor)
VNGENGSPQQQKATIAMAANNRMKAARVLKGLTQLQLAEKVGTKEIEISRFETGRACPDTEMKRRLCEALAKPSFELFDC